jgi:hypothetical protein
MLETTATVQAIVRTSAQVQTMLLSLAAQARAEALHALWTQTPLWFRLLLLVAFVLGGVERLGRCWRRWSRGFL